MLHRFSGDPLLDKGHREGLEALRTKPSLGDTKADTSRHLEPLPGQGEPGRFTVEWTDTSGAYHQPVVEAWTRMARNT